MSSCTRCSWVSPASPVSPSCVQWLCFHLLFVGFPPFCSEKPQGTFFTSCRLLTLVAETASLSNLLSQLSLSLSFSPTPHCFFTDTYRKIMNWRQHLIFSPELPTISREAEHLIRRLVHGGHARHSDLFRSQSWRAGRRYKTLLQWNCYFISVPKSEYLVIVIRVRYRPVPSVVFKIWVILCGKIIIIQVLQDFFICIPNLPLSSPPSPSLPPLPAFSVTHKTELVRMWVS